MKKHIIIQLIKTVIFNRDTVGVLSFLLMVSAPGTEVVQCHCGENLSGRWVINDWKEKMRRKLCCPQCGTGRDTGLGGVLAGA